jgi:hypothetical protein
MTGRAVAEQLGRTPKQLSSVRDELIKAGTLTVDGDELRFTIPGMSATCSRGDGAAPASTRLRLVSLLRNR